MVLRPKSDYSKQFLHWLVNVIKIMQEMSNMQCIPKARANKQYMSLHEFCTVVTHYEEQCSCGPWATWRSLRANERTPN